MWTSNQKAIVLPLSTVKSKTVIQLDESTDLKHEDNATAQREPKSKFYRARIVSHLETHKTVEVTPHKTGGQAN